MELSGDTPRDTDQLVIGLNAVLTVIDNGEPCVLTIAGADGLPSLPYGPFDPSRHRTLELGLRDWVERQTDIDLGYVEQLYTFGDEGREAPAALIAGGDRARIVSVGYLALAAQAAPTMSAAASWRRWYPFFPWEDWRQGEPDMLSGAILPALKAWAERGGGPAERRARDARIRLAYGYSDLGWEEERALDRYELMYEAGLVAEAWRDRARAGLPAPRADRAIAEATGAAMNSDHRRILATAIGRLRGKLKYRAIVFELTPPEFTLLALQRMVEGLIGYDLHKQNFRRSVEQSGLVSKTGDVLQQESGRPAALFEVSSAARLDRSAKGLAIPRLRRRPEFNPDF